VPLIVLTAFNHIFS